ncbi:MAG TPA: DUF222 domain-containing protein [Kineosporiaceae bacterium]|nr:DUF222 domain-containing protein [Kineosporiaceae bacterium]
MIKARERRCSRESAEVIDALMEFARRRPADPTAVVSGAKNLEVDEFAHDEISCALTLTSNTALYRLHFAIDVSERIPSALEAMRRGEIDPGRLKVIEQETAGLPDAEANYLAEETLERMRETPWTTGQLRARLRKRVLGLRSRTENEDEARKKSRAAHGVEIHDLSDGTAQLTLTLSSGAAAAAWAIINSAAYRARTPDDNRTIGQTRVDAFMDLILGRVQDAYAQHAAEPEHNEEGAPDHGADPESQTNASQSADRSHSANASQLANPSHSANANQPANPSGGEPRTDLRRSSGAACNRGGLQTVVNVTISSTEFLKLAQLQPVGAAESGTFVARKSPSAPCSCMPKTDEKNGNARRSEVSVPGEIDGLGAVPGWVIRDLVAEVSARPGTAFRAVIYDPETGELKALSSKRYVPPAALADHVRHRDRTCRFPGCRRVARRCDVDHIKAWGKGGATAECNLQCLCRHHHRLKQNPAWTIRYREGIARWTAPTGHTYASWPADWRDPRTDCPPDGVLNLEEPQEGWPPDGR